MLVTPNVAELFGFLFRGIYVYIYVLFLRNIVRFFFYVKADIKSENGKTLETIDDFKKLRADCKWLFVFKIIFATLYRSLRSDCIIRILLQNKI